MTWSHKLRLYWKQTPVAVRIVDMCRLLAVLASPFLAIAVLRWTATNDLFVAPIHRRLWVNPRYVQAGLVYRGFITAALAVNAAWLLGAVRNFITITTARHFPLPSSHEWDQKLPLPPWPYKRDSFAVILGELQDRDGSRVPNQRSPHLKPRWLILPELSLYTGVFVTGGIGSGKTSAVAYPALKQLLGFRRDMPLRQPDGSMATMPWRFSGLILDEKGDFTRAATRFAEEWDRSGDIIRIAPGGKWIWNVIYNPSLPSWAVAYQLGWILKNFNKGLTGGDPFWENAPKELVTDYLGLLDDARSYYTLFDYLETLVDDGLQNTLQHEALERHSQSPDRLDEIRRRWKSIMKRRDQMSVNLRGALEACARAGIEMFRFPELRRTFCPTKEEYFEHDAVTNSLRPRPNVFTGFDGILDHGRIVGLDMPKQLYFDAAVFIQVALKAQWQDAVLRREAIGSDGELLVRPRFGDSMTHIYLRQADLDSMKIIQEECGKKVAQKTSLAITEGGTSSELSYVHGGIVHQGLGLSSTRTVATEERPFAGVEELKQLPNNVAIVLPSNGDRTLPATCVFRPDPGADSGGTWAGIPE